jgi:phosphoglycerate dehydrogenase-like enzyme
MNNCIWSDVRFTPEVEAAFLAALAGRRLHRSEDSFAGRILPPEVEVAFGQPDPAACLAVPHLRWVHLTTAGYTRFDRDDVRAAFAARGLMVTNSSSVYDDPCAQHVLAMMLALGRQLPASLQEQSGARRWLGGERRRASRLLTGQRVLIFGFGAIGRRLAALLAPFAADVRAVRRRARGDESVPVVSEDQLHAAVASVDHVVNLLPDNASTLRYFDEARFAAFRPGARFYNVGRGTTVDHDALLAVLASGRLDAAYLDVTDPEPLPPSHPLWSAPNCYITPHSAGGRHDQDEAVLQHFLGNLARFDRGEPLQDRVI